VYQSFEEMKTLVTISLLVSLAIGAYFYFSTNPRHRAHSIAVIPFENLRSEPGQEILIDGVAEGILNSLSQQEGLKVSARMSSFQFRGGDTELDEISKKLGVQAIVDGAVEIDGDRVKITVQLINAEDQMHLWSQRYEGNVEDILSIQDKIANSIAKALLPSSRRVVTQRTANKEAYELYLKGRSHWNLRTPNELLKGVEAFEEAIEKDPEFGAAYAGLADCYTALGYSSFLSPKQSFPKAFDAATKALKLDTTLAEAHATLGYYQFYYEWDWAQAEQEFRKAISINPNHELAYDWYGYYLTAMQRYDEAHVVFAKAASLDPLSAGIGTDMGFSLYYNKKYDQAAEALTAALELNPNFPLARIWLGRVYQVKKMYDQSIDEYKKAITVTSGWPVAYAQIGNVYGVSGNHQQARVVLDSLNSFTSKKFVTSYGVALVYAGLGEKAKAYEWLNKAYDERSHWLVWLKTDPRWDEYRSETQFTELLARIGLPEIKD
jgi:TolB-like protein/Tfp pilus assembly protein PilF